MSQSEYIRHARIKSSFTDSKAVIGTIKAYNPEEDGEYTIIENRDSYKETLMKAFPYNKVERTDGYGKWKNPDCRYCRRAGTEYCHRIECHSWENKENIRRNGETRAAAFGRETVHSKYGRDTLGTK
jgi:hypothetical protein